MSDQATPKSRPQGHYEAKLARPVHSTLEAALDYAARGWAIFPVPIGTKRSHKSAEHSNGVRWGQTKDPDVIRRDFRRWPNANVGTPTGRDNGFWVLEIDTIAGHNVNGWGSLVDLWTTHGPFPETLVAESPSGSLHYYFKYPAGDVRIINSASKIAPGIDVRGEGGMVIAPPSIKPGAPVPYSWLAELPIADAPQWLLDLVIEKPKPEKPPKATRGSPQTDFAAAERMTDFDQAKVQAALDVIDSNCTYDIWFSVAAALRWEFGVDGRDMFLQWSARSPQYDADEAYAKWDDVSDVTNLSAATIFYLADIADRRWRAGYEQRERERINAELADVYARFAK